MVKVEIVLASEEACDGERVDVDVVVVPSDAESYLSGVTFFATKPDGGTDFDNPAGQGITLSQRGDVTEWQIDNVRWYSTQSDHCNETADYKIWAQCTIGGEVCEAVAVTFTADTTFGVCLDGAAELVDPWSGDIEITVEQLTNGQWAATITQGTFRRDVQAISWWSVPENSQFYEMVRDEELFHEGQFEGTTSQILSDLWDAQRVISEATASQPFVADTEDAARQAARNAFNAALLAEEMRSGNEYDARRCDVEREAKAAAGASYRVALPCTYPGCP